MALYDMKCEGCGHAYEAEAPMADGPPKKCPSCKKNKLQQVYSPTPYHNHYSPAHPRKNRGRGH